MIINPSTARPHTEAAFRAAKLAEDDDAVEVDPKYLERILPQLVNSPRQPQTPQTTRMRLSHPVNC